MKKGKNEMIYFYIYLIYLKIKIYLKQALCRFLVMAIIITYIFILYKGTKYIYIVLIFTKNKILTEKKSLIIQKYPYLLSNVIKKALKKQQTLR